MLAAPRLLLAGLLSLVYIVPFVKVGDPALQGAINVRVLAILVISLVAGCSTWPLASGSADDIPAEAVRSYAKAHGLSREEARRELTALRDADHLKELRQSQGTKRDNLQATFMTP